MGRGRNRRPRNFATFRLCPRPGAFDASDRVFVRVDRNPYQCPGFADGGGAPSYNDGGEEEDLSSSGEGALPEHVRREILDLGLPDDGYNYLRHLREFRPPFSCGASAAFLPSHRLTLFGLPPDVKAYDARRLCVVSNEVAKMEASDSAETETEEAIDMDVVKMLDEMEKDINIYVGKLLEDSDVPAVIDLDVAKLLEDGDVREVEAGSEDEGLEEDFVMVASQPEEEEQIIFVTDGDEQFVLVTLENNVDSEQVSGETNARD